MQTNTSPRIATLHVTAVTKEGSSQHSFSHLIQGPKRQPRNRSGKMPREEPASASGSCVRPRKKLRFQRHSEMRPHWARGDTPYKENLQWRSLQEEVSDRPD